MRLDGTWLLLFAYFILVLSGIVIPSDGSHGFFSPKSLTFLFAVFAFFIHLVINPVITAPIQQLFSASSALLLLLGGFLAWGFAYPTQAVDQYKLFLITVFVPLLSLYLLFRGLIRTKTLLKFIIFTSFAFSCAKLLLVGLHLVHAIDLFKLMEKAGIRFMSMGIYGSLARVQTSVDILTPFALYFALMHKSFDFKLPKWFMAAFIPFTWMALVLSFSRYLFILGVMAHLCYWMTVSHKRLSWILFRICGLITALVFLIGPIKVAEVLEKRFYSEHSSRSDEARKIQVDALTEAFFFNPLLGKGMGGYAEDSIRDSTIKHSYEVQWVAFLMQFGLLGLSFLLAPLLYIIYLLFPVDRLRASLLVMFLLWLLSGFTNPFLISLTSGIIYSVFLLAGRYFSTTEVGLSGRKVETIDLAHGAKNVIN